MIDDDSDDDDDDDDNDDDDDVRVFDFALRRRVLALLCLLSNPHCNGIRIFTTSVKKSPDLVMLDLV